MQKTVCLEIALIALMMSYQCGCAQEDTPVNNFERLFWDYDMRYAQFGIKDIDWNEVYATHRPRVYNQMSNDELFEVLADVLAVVNDNHAILYGMGKMFQSGSLGGKPMKDFDLDVTKKYIRDPQKAGAGNFNYGTISDRIGYLHIGSMLSDQEGWSSEIDNVLQRLDGVEAMIVDVRGNEGGMDHDSFNIANRFADQKRVVMKTKYRNGPNHDDFGPTKTWYVKPKGPRQFTGPTVLLTHLHTVSGAETFSLAMRKLPHVTQMGTTTSGAFANQVKRELLNGWIYTLPIGLFLNSDGVCYEGIGLAPLPENQIENIPENVEQGVDVVLEAAVAHLSASLP